MGFAFRLMIYVVMFNLAVGLSTLMFGATYLTSLNSQAALTGPGSVSDFNSQMSASASTPMEQSSTWYIYILNIISLGFFQKIMTFMNSTIFSIPTLLFNIGLLPSALLVWVNGIILFIMGLGMFEIFTGRDLTVR